MIRLAYVCADAGVPVFGHKGCSVHVQEFVRACVEEGVAVHLFAARFGGAAPTDLSTVPVTRLEGGEVAPSDDAVRDGERRALTRDKRVGEYLATVAPFDVVYERHALWSAGAMQWARRHATPAVLEVNAPLVEEQQRFRVLRDAETARAVRRDAFAAADVVLPVSSALGDWIVAEGVPRDRVHVVPNAVAPARFSAPVVPALARRDDLVTLGFVGTLKPWHGVHVLVDAVGRLRARGVALRLLVVGEGPERPALAARVRDAGLDGDVIWAGDVAPADVPAWLASMDIGIAPYADAADAYFSPLKVFEYMAAGLPVVASSIGQIPSVLPAGAGTLCAPGDVSALAEALAALCASPSRRASAGEVGRTTVLARHTWRATVRRVLALALAQGRRPGHRTDAAGTSLEVGDARRRAC